MWAGSQAPAEMKRLCHPNCKKKKKKRGVFRLIVNLIKLFCVLRVKKRFEKKWFIHPFILEIFSEYLFFMLC